VDGRPQLKARFFEKAVSIRMKPQQDFHASPQVGVAGAGLGQERGALLARLVDRLRNNLLFGHGTQPRSSQDLDFPL
jgi:hypothetical protein